MKPSRAKKPATEPMPLKQRLRLQPTSVKAGPDRVSAPAEKLRLAFELSDFCAALREAARRKG